jgi:hypothetical protein
VAPLEAEVRSTPAVVGLTGEMKNLHDVFQGIERGDEGTLTSVNVSAALGWLPRPAARLLHAHVLEQHHRLIEYARLQPHERAARKLRPPSEEPQPWWARQFMSMFVAGLERSILSGDEYRGLATVALTAVALRRYRLDQGGYPAALDALVPTYLAQVPVDPFTGRPIAYTQAGSGFDLEVKAPREEAARQFHWSVPR